MRLKVGQLVKLKKDHPGLKLHAGDYAILTEIDWDARHYPKGIAGNSGRGFFFFPDRSPSSMRDGQLGYMLLYNDFEVLDEG
jgi:hypothetical protein